MEEGSAQMAPDDTLPVQMDSRDQHLVLFLPFLRLSEPHAIAGIEFVPLRDREDMAPAVLGSVAESIDSLQESQ